jgi:hypothetical protein
VEEQTTVVVWNGDGATFTDDRYSCGHRWLVHGGIEVPASSSAHLVAPSLSVAVAVGGLGRDGRGKAAMTRVTLRPEVRFTETTHPPTTGLLALHREAHERCFLASSVRAEVHCEPALGDAPAREGVSARSGWRRPRGRREAPRT